MDTNEDFNAQYSEKVAEAWGEVLASGERRVGALVTTGALLNAWKAAVKARDKSWMDEVADLLPFGLDKAERLMAIAATPLLADSANWRILPPHLSTLYALAKLDHRVGEGTLACAMQLMHHDITVRDIDDIVEALTPAAVKRLSPAEQAAGAARPVLEAAEPLSPAEHAEALLPTSWGLEVEQRKFKILLSRVDEAATAWLTRCPESDRGWPIDAIDKLLQELRAREEEFRLVSRRAA